MAARSMSNDWRVVEQALRDQGWRLERTGNGHFKAFPPDRTKRMVVLAESNDPRAFKNQLSDLRKSGFLWRRDEDEVESRPSPPPASENRLGFAAVEPIRSAQAQMALLASPAESERWETFRAALFGLRTREGLSQAQLGELVGVSGQAVLAWEAGMAVPVAEHYRALLDLLPGLSNAPEPPVRNIPKPEGNRLVRRLGQVVSMATPLLAESAETAAEPQTTTEELPEPEESSAAEKEDSVKSLDGDSMEIDPNALDEEEEEEAPRPTKMGIDRTAVKELVRLVVRIRAEPQIADVLRTIRDRGLSVEDVLDLLDD